MSQLEWPYKRIELTSWLQEIIHCSTDDFDIDEVIHFFFDDTDLYSDIETTVGKYIYTDEVHPIKKFLDNLSDLVTKLGDVGTDVFLSSPEWPVVARLASEAAKIIEENNQSRSNFV
jgi:hypothetical protein